MNNYCNGFITEFKFLHLVKLRGVAKCKVNPYYSFNRIKVVLL